MGIVPLVELKTFPRANARLQNRAGQKHHYIPKFYLKQWAGDDGRLCEFSKPHDIVKARMTHPGGTGFLRGLYTFPTLPVALASALEQRFLMRTDNEACAALSQLLHGDANLNAAQRCAWSRFIMTLIHRTPEALDRYAAKIALEYPTFLEEALADLPDHLREATSPDAIRRLRSGLSEADLERMLFGSLQTMMDSEFLGTALNSMLMGVLEFHDSHHLLHTSDRPMVMSNGLNRPDAELSIPISPRRIVVMANNMEMLKKIEAMARSGGLAQRINNRMARQARKYVYGTDARALKFIESRLGEKAAWSPLE